MKTWMFVLTVAFSQFGLAGEKVGNGGGAWICRDSKGINKAELSDLWEAQNIFGLTLADFASQAHEEILHVQFKRLQRAMPKFGVPVAQLYYEIKKQIVFTGGVLSETGDGVYQVKPGPEFCNSGNVEFFQLANFTDYAKLLISQQMWTSGLLTETHKAALLAHETIYRHMRMNFSDTTSVRARLIVGTLFSTKSEGELEMELIHILNHTPDGECIGPVAYCDMVAGAVIHPELERIYQNEGGNLQIKFKRGAPGRLIMENIGLQDWPWQERVIEFTSNQNTFRWDAGVTGANGEPFQLRIEIFGSATGEKSRVDLWEMGIGGGHLEIYDMNLQ